MNICACSKGSHKNNISPSLLAAIEERIRRNRHVLHVITSIAPVIAGALRPEMKEHGLRYSMLDLAKEISKMLGKESLGRTELSRLFDIQTNVTTAPDVGTKRKFMSE